MKKFSVPSKGQKLLDHCIDHPYFNNFTTIDTIRTVCTMIFAFKLPHHSQIIQTKIHAIQSSDGRSMRPSLRSALRIRQEVRVELFIAKLNQYLIHFSNPKSYFSSPLTNTSSSLLYTRKQCSSKDNAGVKSGSNGKKI